MRKYYIGFLLLLMVSFPCSASIEIFKEKCRTYLPSVASVAVGATIFGTLHTAHALYNNNPIFKCNDGNTDILIGLTGLITGLGYYMYQNKIPSAPLINQCNQAAHTINRYVVTTPNRIIRVVNDAINEHSYNNLQQCPITKSEVHKYTSHNFSVIPPSYTKESIESSKNNLKIFHYFGIDCPMGLSKTLSYNNGIKLRISLGDGSIDHTFSDNLLNQCKKLQNYLEFEKKDVEDVDIDLSCISINTFKNFISLLEKIYSLNDQEQINSVINQIKHKIESNKIDLVTALEYECILGKLFTSNKDDFDIISSIKKIYDIKHFFKNLENNAKIDQLFNILSCNPHLEIPVLNKAIELINKQKLTPSEINSVIYLLNKIDQFYGADEVRKLRSDYAKNIFCIAASHIRCQNIIFHDQLNKKDALNSWKFGRCIGNEKYFLLNGNIIFSKDLKSIFPDRKFFIISTTDIDCNKDKTKFVYTVGEGLCRYPETSMNKIAIFYNAMNQQHTIIGEVAHCCESAEYIPVRISADGKYICANFCGDYISSVDDTTMINVSDSTIISFIGEENRIAYREGKIVDLESNELTSKSTIIYDINAKTSEVIDHLPCMGKQTLSIDIKDKEFTVNMIRSKFRKDGYHNFSNQDFSHNLYGCLASFESITFKEDYFKILERVTTLECAGALKILLESGYFNGNCSLDEQTQEKLLDLIPQSILDLLQDASSSWLDSVD